MAARALVSVVDDDESVRESLPDLLRELGFDAAAFSSGEDFLASDRVGLTKCLLLDVAMPGMTGPELQGELAKRKISIPIVFITAQQNGKLRSQLVKSGASACLFKPFSAIDLQNALNAALWPR
jgi:FixJ family two-component response regulator